MLKSEFFYDLPPKLIAQTPIEPRDSSRLLKIDRVTGGLIHDRFYNICDYLKSGDLIVLNDSKVFPARIYGKKRGSGIDVEFLLLKQKSGNIWEAMSKPGRRLKEGAIVDFECGLSAKILDTAADGNKLVEFDFKGVFFELLEKIGQMPLPPYITEKLENKSRYNTVYSKNTGSSAAPTAGLHFTESIFKKIPEKGADTAFITLHVGLGTFRPVKTDDISEHIMHSEHFVIPQETADKINNCKAHGGRVIALGTTSCRTLESAAGMNGGVVSAMSGSTDIFIYPGYEFKVIDGLITNFHLPESTLIMLVCAFLGYDRTMNAYKAAIEEEYRFFSFGDAMFII